MIKKKLYIIIPAKMTSKGIKRKNLRLINGKSLVNITISQAIKLIHKIFVSSENKNLEKKNNKKKYHFSFKTKKTFKEQCSCNSCCT